MATVEKIAETVLYEGYLLYPYTRSAMKNQQRWTFGGVYPRRYSEETGGNDPWIMQTQCLVAGDARTTIEVKLRFLHIVDRTVIDLAAETSNEVEELRVGDQVYRPWEEAAERAIIVGPMPIDGLVGHTGSFPVAIGGGSEAEPLTNDDGVEVGALRHDWQSLQGALELDVEPLPSGLYRLTARITNTTPWLTAEPDVSRRGVSGSVARAGALRRTFISTHTILRVQGGEFVSLLEPPEAYAEAAAECDNIKTWPVLVGESGERHTVLSSPIILYDYPQIAPETPGDLFDATEIDELLRLSIMTLTDEEKQEMRESDPRGREILERTESLTPEQLMSLHGTVRSVQTLRQVEP